MNSQHPPSFKELFGDIPKYQRVRKALDLIGIGRTKLYRLAAEGRITIIKMGNASFVDMTTVAALFAQCPEFTSMKVIEKQTMSAEQLGLPAEPPVDTPPEMADGLPAFTLTAADLDGLASPHSEPQDRRHWP